MKTTRLPAALSILGIVLLLANSGEARPPQGFLPPGLAKKAAAGEELPPPWQNGGFIPPGQAKKGYAPKEGKEKKWKRED